MNHNYYHLTPDRTIIISGPHHIRSEYIGALTGWCGNPELLDLNALNLVPQVWPELAAGYRYGGAPSIAPDGLSVIEGVEPIPAEELEATRLTNLRQSCNTHIELTLGWNRERQLSAIAGVYPLPILDAMRDAIAASIGECNRCEDDLAAAPSWPVAPAALSYEEAKNA